MGQMIAVAAMVTAMIGAVGALGIAGRWLWRAVSKLVHLADALMGTPDRPGVLQRIAALEQLLTTRLDALEERVARMDDRLAIVEAQLRKNGGDSLRDAVDRLQQPVDVAA